MKKKLILEDFLFEEIQKIPKKDKSQFLNKTQKRITPKNKIIKKKLKKKKEIFYTKNLEINLRKNSYLLKDLKNEIFEKNQKNNNFENKKKHYSKKSLDFFEQKTNKEKSENSNKISNFENNEILDNKEISSSLTIKTQKSSFISFNSSKIKNNKENVKIGKIDKNLKYCFGPKNENSKTFNFDLNLIKKEKKGIYPHSCKNANFKLIKLFSGEKKKKKKLLFSRG